MNDWLDTGFPQISQHPSFHVPPYLESTQLSWASGAPWWPVERGGLCALEDGGSSPFFSQPNQVQVQLFSHVLFHFLPASPKSSYSCPMRSEKKWILIFLTWVDSVGWTKEYRVWPLFSLKSKEEKSFISVCVSVCLPIYLFSQHEMKQVMKSQFYKFICFIYVSSSFSLNHFIASGLLIGFCLITLTMF